MLLIRERLMIMNIKNAAQIFVRFALAITFLSAVADRFGLWGVPGAPHVAWGNYAKFLDYTAILVPWVPKALATILGGIATFLEVGFALMLILGFRIKEVSLGSAILLLTFALSMAFTVGIKAPLDYSVFSASAAAFLLYSAVQAR